MFFFVFVFFGSPAEKILWNNPILSKNLELILSCSFSNFYDSLNSFRHGVHSFKEVFVIKVVPTYPNDSLYIFFAW